MLKYGACKSQTLFNWIQNIHIAISIQLTVHFFFFFLCMHQLSRWFLSSSTNHKVQNVWSKQKSIQWHLWNVVLTSLEIKPSLSESKTRPSENAVKSWMRLIWSATTPPCTNIPCCSLNVSLLCVEMYFSLWYLLLDSFKQSWKEITHVYSKVVLE